MKAAYKTKAENGWWPYRHTPLGYVHSKDRDKFGNAIKGTARLIPDPDTCNVQLIQREFELRAQGFSYDEIRRQNLEDNFVPPENRKTYNRATIEKRMKNPLYWGEFRLADDPKVYKGKHEPIIPTKTLKSVKAINEGNGCKRRSMVANGADIFRGWLVCDHPECQRQITYEKKEKVLKSTGETKVYHLYRCSNSRKIHPKNIYVSEEKIWQQFETTADVLSVSQEFAQDITNALNETHGKQTTAIKKQMDGFSIELRNLEGKEDEAYNDFKVGVLDEGGYKRQITRVRDERRHFESEIKRLTLTISDEAMVSVKKVFELAINAKELYKSMSREERLEYLKTVCSNATLDGLTLQYQLEKPFARLASWNENSEWRRG